MQAPKLVITGRDGILNVFRSDHVKAPAFAMLPLTSARPGSVVVTSVGCVPQAAAVNGVASLVGRRQYSGSFFTRSSNRLIRGSTAAKPVRLWTESTPRRMKKVNFSPGRRPSTSPRAVASAMGRLLRGFRKWSRMTRGTNGLGRSARDRKRRELTRARI